MKIAKIRDVKTPTRGTAKSAGLDFYVPYDFLPTRIGPLSSLKIPSGIRANIPEGYALVALNKSGIALEHGLIVGACLVDEDYQGEMHLHLFNVSSNFVWITPGMRIEQFACMPINYIDVEVVELKDLYSEETERGEGGFGSTDINPFDGNYMCAGCLKIVSYKEDHICEVPPTK